MEKSDMILIVDDNEINRSMLENIFFRNYRILEAENGQEAMEKLFRYKDVICAVLLDVVMPVMDGMEVLEKLHMLGWTKWMPVFLITAETEGRMLQRAYSLDVMDVITKPVVPYIVERRINSVIELFQTRKKLSCKVQEQQTEILEQTRKILDLNEGLIEALATTIEFRSGESGAHVRRIRDITQHLLLYTDLGKGMSKETVSHIALASIMHDVGKIAIPDAILNKPGRLTAEEFELMKAHTLRGAELLERIPQLKKQETFRYAYDIARHHHERWDGKGYPDGLSGDENTIWAQIVSIADVYDALVSRRIYKESYSADTAMQMIMNGESGVFNPFLLEQFQHVEKDLRSFYADDTEENTV